MSGRRLAWRAALALFLLAGASHAADWLLRTENFPVRQLRFEGPFERVAPAELEAAVLPHVRGNFFLVDLAVVREQVESLPWIRRASVARRLPQDIAIEFSEQRIVARWGEDAWLNHEAEVVHFAVDPGLGELPRLNGPEGSALQVRIAYVDFRAILAPLGLELAGLELAPRRSWELLVAAPDGARLALVLDNAEPRARLRRFARAYPGVLAARVASVRRIDLRYTNGFAVEWGGRGGATPRLAGTAESRGEG